MNLYACQRRFFFAHFFWTVLSVVPVVAQEKGLFPPDRVRLERAREAEADARQKGDSLALAEAYYLYGKTYTLSGDFLTAQRYLVKAIRILEPRGNSFELGRLYLRVGEIEGRMEQAAAAHRYVLRAEKTFRSIRSDDGLFRVYGALGHWHSKFPKYSPKMHFDSTLYYFSLAKSHAIRFRDSLALAEADLQLGSVYRHHRHGEAVPYLQNALRLYRALHRDGSVIFCLMELSQTYIHTHQYLRAFSLLKEAEAIYATRQKEDYDTRLGLLQAFRLYYLNTGQWQKAYAQLDTIFRLERIRLTADRNAQIEKLGIEFETEKKEAALQMNRKELEHNAINLRSQRQFIVTLCGLFILTGVMSVVFFRLYRKNRRISAQNRELLQEQNHRVKNNLQVVSSLLGLQADQLMDETARAAVGESRLRVQSMAVLHRKLYDGRELAKVDLEEFIPELVEGILQLFGFPELAQDFRIDPVLLPADKATPLGLILNELVTNACKYAFPDNPAPKLSIHCRRKGDRLYLIVADNGPGLPGLPSESVSLKTLLRQPGSTFGIPLIQSQVVQLNATGYFETMDAAGGTRFRMEFKI